MNGEVFALFNFFFVPGFICSEKNNVCIILWEVLSLFTDTNVTSFPPLLRTLLSTFLRPRRWRALAPSEANRLRKSLVGNFIVGRKLLFFLFFFCFVQRFILFDGHSAKPKLQDGF